jgi:tetratricopeptide (TPR) repeat protein
MDRFRVTANHRRFAPCILALTAVFGALTVQGQSFEVQPDSAGTAILQGVVRDSGNHPVAGVTVCLQAMDFQTLTVRTDSAGIYRFSSVRQGVYTVRAEMPGYSGISSSSFVLGQKESRTMDLTIGYTKTSEPQNSSAGRPEFFDEPHFTVAGVTDTTNLGGHGSDAIVRNRDALAKATAALRKAPRGSTDEDEAGRHHSLADADEKRGDPLEAVREYQRAAELNPSESNLFDWGAELLMHRAAEPAIEVFAKGNRMFPHSVRMLAGLGGAWYVRGSYDQAVQRLCEASDLDPDDSAPYLFMGEMQAVETAQSEAVVERLARFARLQPENALANYYYAASLWKRRQSPEEVADVAQVEALLEKAIHLDPKLGPAYLQLGVLYSEQKDFSKAISEYQRAIAASPKLEEAHYRLVQAYRRAGETSKARAELQLYAQISKEKEEELNHERHELRQFVYQLRDQPSAVQQK